eukprot:Nk52_evm8s290 gene=Nk52_evmTU8s290
MIGMKSLLLVTLLASAAFLFSGASAGDTWGNYPGCGNDVNSNYHWKYKFCKNPKMTKNEFGDNTPRKCVGPANVVIAFDENDNVITEVMWPNNENVYPCGTKSSDKHVASHAVYMKDHKGREWNTCVCPKGTRYCGGYWGYCGHSEN